MPEPWQSLQPAAGASRPHAELRDALSRQEALLRDTRRNLEAIYQASGDGLALCRAIRDGEGRLIDYQVLEVNRAHRELTAATREQMLTMRVSTIAPPVDPRWFESADKVLKTGIMQNFDVRSPATGRWLNIRVSRVSDELFQQTFVDVSDRRRLEEQRMDLFKEMSHRVMNNFQTVASFLRIQAASADPAASEQLRMAERRVQVLARLHSFLSYTDGVGEVDAASYVEELCSYLRSAIDRPDAVTIACEAELLPLPADIVVPLGFVVCELVTNSAKYAYPPPMSGAIHIRLGPRPAGWTLTIEDNGRGLTEGASPPRGGLGTRLVRGFVEQIGAELVTTSRGGVHHEIRFPGA